MKSTTCEAYLDALADWVDMTYTSKKDFNIVARIATDVERIRWAKEVLVKYRSSSELMELLAELDGSKEATEEKRITAEKRIIALRQAFVYLAEGKYKVRVNTYCASLSCRKVFDSTMRHSEYVAVAV